MRIQRLVLLILEQPPLIGEIVIHPTLNVLYFENAPGVALAKISQAWK